MRFSARGGAGLAFAGLVVVLVGAFLPWLRSGSALRDSYQSVDVLRVQPAPPGGAAGVLLYAWLAVIPLCSVSVALYALGVRRTAAALACLLAVLAWSHDPGILDELELTSDVRVETDETKAAPRFIGRGDSSARSSVSIAPYSRPRRKIR